MRRLLLKLAHKHTAKQFLVERSQLILLLLDDTTNTEAARELGLHRQTVRNWRSRWLAAQPDLVQAEAQALAQVATDPTLKVEPVLLDYLEQLLTDLPRPGAPATFTPEQIALIVAVACEDPALSDLPLSHWSERELAREVARRGIVAQISPRSVGRFLKGSQD